MDSREVLQLLQAGVADHEAGRGERAEAAYRRVLQIQPNNADALHLLGVLYTQAGRADVAVPMLRAAIAALPTFPQFHLHLAQALALLDQRAEAIDSLARAIQLNPNDALPRAEAARVLTEMGRTADALIQHRLAAELAPQNAGFVGNYGLSLCRAGQFDQGVTVLRRAVAMAPDDAGVMLQLAESLWQAKYYDEAYEYAKKASDRLPDVPHVTLLLGNTLQTLARFADAAQAYRRVLERQPDSFDAHSNLALTVLKMGDARQSLAMYDQIVARWPDRADSLANRSLVILTLGDLKRGFAEYEARFRVQAFDQKAVGIRGRWDGSDPRGKTIILTSEQGMGDVVQFLRYVPLLAARGATVWIACPTELHPVAKTVKGITRIFANREAVPPFDLQLPLGSLPAVFKTEIDTIPRDVPYISADPERVTRWRERFLSDAKFKVGIVWAGTPLHLNDRARSCRLSDFGVLADVEGVSFYSLQKGRPADQLAAPPAALAITPLGDDLKDFGDTAALIECLDLVISVDTSVVHVAGALGRPVWTLLAKGPDWRWMLDREDSPWYPTMRLFRQQQLANWQPVLARVADELKLLVKEKT
jgi:tetratricopeptide (TPR) repeat protein